MQEPAGVEGQRRLAVQLDRPAEVRQGGVCVAQAVVEAAAVVEGGGVVGLKLQGPRVVLDGCVVVPQPVVAESPVVVRPAVPWLQVDCAGVVGDGRVKLPLRLFAGRRRELSVGAVQVWMHTHSRGKMGGGGGGGGAVCVCVCVKGKPDLLPEREPPVVVEVGVVRILLDGGREVCSRRLILAHAVAGDATVVEGVTVGRLDLQRQRVVLNGLGVPPHL